MENQDIFKILNQIFTDEEFLIESAIYKDGFIFSDLMYQLSKILCYYITTRDSRILSLEEITNNYFSIKDEVPSKEHLNNVLIDGYLTHSFPGVEKKYVEEFGFDFFNKLPLDEKNKLQIIRRGLVTLEQYLGECSYLHDRIKKNTKEIVDKEIYMTFPGTKTIYYSVFAPERLYRGPIDCNLFDRFPIVVGESKKEYLMRIIKYRKKYSNKGISDEEILNLSDLVLDYYSKKSPCISFINIKEIKDIPIFTTMYNHKNNDRFEDYYLTMSRGDYVLKDIFTEKMNDHMEFYDRGNYVTLSSFIDKNYISLVDFPDWYNLRQAFLKRTGIPEGTLVSYGDCRTLNNFDEISEDVKVLYKKI